MKKLVFTIFIVASLLVINNVLHSIYGFWQKEHLVDTANQTLQQAQKENERLKRELLIAKTPEFIEQEARNKLLLARPKEEEVVIPPKSENLTTSQPQAQNIPNWQKWLNLFF